jgi:pimeloyl-ACP methyl ester carboxylesterase
MQLRPETRYAKSGGWNIAYQVFGTGEVDLVLVPGFTSHLDYIWEEPGLARFLTNLGSFSRLILYDKRGSGLSDRTPEPPTLEDRMADLLAVLDAVGSERSALLAWSDGGPMSLLFGATHPGRTSGLVLIGTAARFLAADDYPQGIDPDLHRTFIEAMEEEWGTGVGLLFFAPSMQESARFKQWWARYQRAAASPIAAADVLRMEHEIDARQVLPAIRVPTLVIHAARDTIVPVECGRYLAQHIPGARYLELDSMDHMYWTTNADKAIDEIEGFLTSKEPARHRDHLFCTLLFTDIADSTRKAGRLGDRRWREVLDAHNNLLRMQIDKFEGREIKSTGDGFLVAFDGPIRAVMCATAITQGAPEVGVKVRAGVHAGECVTMGEDLGGVTVHLAARVAAAAAPGEVLITNTVRGLVAGSGLKFLDRGHTPLKGIGRPPRLYSVVS